MDAEQKEYPSILQQITNAIFVSECNANGKIRHEKPVKQNWWWQTCIIQVVFHRWHLFCPQNIKVDSYREIKKNQRKKNLVKNSLQQQLLWFCFLFPFRFLFFICDSFFFVVVINFIITLVCAVRAHKKHS